MIEPTEWIAILQLDYVIILDTRHDYEVQLGTFQGAQNPKTESFSDFPKFVETSLANVKDKPVAMFCTGGIRCEKAASYLAQQGFQKVYNLKGGILKYLEVVPSTDSLWQGECFVFDQRVSVKHGLQLGNCELCRGCRHPLQPTDLDEHYLKGVHCTYCYSKLDADKIRAAKERDRQMQLAKQRNEKHLGYVHPAHKKIKVGDESECNL